MLPQLILVLLVVLCAADDPVDVRNKFVFYHGDGIEVYDVSDGTSILRSHRFDSFKKTVLYIHGYIETQDSESVKTVAAAYQTRDDYNFIALDWSIDAGGNYVLRAFPRMRVVADVVAKKMLNMIDAGLDVEKLHLVGHSLGGQMVGRIAKEVKNRSRGKVVLKRITALDPAFPGFYGPLMQHVSRNDAEFVDIIHTDAFGYGGPSSSGHVDFWPNGGVRVQPGCPVGVYLPLNANDLCSHWRSWHFWAESVTRSNPLKFNAVAATSWTAFKNGRVRQFDEAVVMGNDCPTDIEGNYYLQTNTVEPFARGVDGVTYTKTLDTSTDPKSVNAKNA